MSLSSVVCVTRFISADLYYHHHPSFLSGRWTKNILPESRSWKRNIPTPPSSITILTNNNGDRKKLRRSKRFIMSDVPIEPSVSENISYLSSQTF